MKKQINFLLLLLVALTVLEGCKDPDLPDNRQKKCKWSSDERIRFSEVKFYHPTNNIIAALHENPTYGFPSIFTGSKSKISVTVKGTGCTGTESKSTEYKNASMTSGWLTKVNGITNSDFEATIEVVSGPYIDQYGYSGVIIWSKKLLGNPFVDTQNGIFRSASFKKSYAKIRRIWMGRGFEERMHTR